MEQVYRNSFCNIAAADSENGAGGLFRQREARDVLPAIVDPDGVSPILDKRRWVIVRGDLWEQGLLVKPLYRRGWVYQGQCL